MAPIGPRQIAICAGAVVLALVLGLGQLARARGGDDATPAAAAPIAIEDAGAGERVVVHVAGAVRRPGVYRLRSGSRVQDAVRLAGGAKPRADLGGLNLAAKLEDGRQVLVPRREPAAGGGAAAATPAKVNLNTATEVQLDGLAGVGPATAAKILAYREQHGSFGAVDELGDVPGIGERRLEALRELVTV
jgi:competence protein ComEA